MPEGFDLFAKDWGPQSLLALAVLAIILGLLEPWWRVKGREAILKSQIVEAQEQRDKAIASAEKLQEAVVLQSRHLEQLNEQSAMTIALLQGIQKAAASAPYASSLQGRHRGET